MSNQENAELRRLEDIRLSETMLPFTTNEDRTSIDATPAAANNGASEALHARMDELNLTGTTRQIVEGFGQSILMRREPGKTLNLTEKPNPWEGKNLDWFQIDLNRETVQDMVGTTIDPNAAVQRRFATTAFTSEAQKQQTLYNLVNYCYMKLNQPFTDDEAMAAFAGAANVETARTRMQQKRQRQLNACITFMGNFNPCILQHQHQKQLAKSIQNDVLRKTTLKELGGRQIIAPPPLGKSSNADTIVLKDLDIIISRTPFGSPHNTKPLSYFLERAFSVIAGTYSEKGSYQVLRSVLCSKPYELVMGNEEEGLPFEQTWMDLQYSFGTYGDSDEGIDRKIEECLRTRPVDIKSTIAELRMLIRKKNRNLDLAERDIISNSQIKSYIFKLLAIWHPTYVPTVRHRFEELESHVREHDYKAIPSPILLTRIIAEYVKDSRAVSQTQARINELHLYGLSEVSELSTPQNASQYSSNEGNLEISAFQFRNQGNQNNTKYSFDIPDHLKDKCLKCANPGHLYRECPKYPGEPLSSTVCIYCRGKHSSKCKNLGIHEMQALPAPEDVQGLENSNFQAQSQYQGQFNQQ